MTPRIPLGVAALLLAFSSPAFSDEPLKSGPQVGSLNDGSFFVPRWVTTSIAGKRVCPVCCNNDLVALVFARETSDSLTALVKRMDKAMQGAAYKTERPLGAYVVFMKQMPKLEMELRKLAMNESIKEVPLGICVPPQNYGIAADADVTIAIYNIGQRGEQRVSANFALRKGELTEAKADAIVAALTAVLPPPVVEVVPTSREKAQDWRYTLEKPESNWHKAEFNDTAWKTGPGGFGNKGTPNAVDRTPWHTDVIWIRREVVLPARGLNRLLLQIHADDYADIYLNGVLAVKITKCTPTYQEFAISEEAMRTLRPGPNLLAVTCRDSGGGRYIDVGLVETKR